MYLSAITEYLSNQPMPRTGLIMPEGKTTIRLFLVLLLLFATMGAEPASSEMVTGCHCFKQRSYDPEARFAADDYILATSFNSLTANTFNIPKRQIIMLKMKAGIHQNDLLIALKISQDFNIDLQKLLSLHQQHHSWQTILADFKKLSKIKDNELLNMIRAGRPVNDLGLKVTNTMIADFYDIPKKDVEHLRLQGLNEKEMALCFLLFRNKQVNPEDIVRQVKINGQSWSEIAHKLGISPTMAGQLIASYGK